MHLANFQFNRQWLANGNFSLLAITPLYYKEYSDSYKKNNLHHKSRDYPRDHCAEKVTERAVCEEEFLSRALPVDKRVTERSVQRFGARRQERDVE